MNWVDVIVLVLVLGLGLLGWTRGVIRLGFTFVGGIVAMALAGGLYDDLAPALPIDNDGWAELAAFSVIVVVVMALSIITANTLKTMLKAMMLGWVDNSAGALLGAVLGAFAATAFVSAAGIVPSASSQQAVEASLLARPLVSVFGIVLALLPDEFDRVRTLLSDRASSAVAEISSPNL